MVNYSLFPAVSQQSRDSVQPGTVHRISTSLRHRFSIISRISFGAPRIFNSEEFDLVHNYLAGAIDFPLPPLNLSSLQTSGKERSASPPNDISHAYLSRAASNDTIETPTSPCFTSEPSTWSPMTSRTSDYGDPSDAESFWTAPQSKRHSLRPNSVAISDNSKGKTKLPAASISTQRSKEQKSTRSTKSQDTLWPGWKNGIGGANRESIMRDSSTSSIVARAHDKQNPQATAEISRQIAVPICANRSERMLATKRVFGLTVGTSPLIEAARENNYGELLRLLDVKRANVNVTDKHGLTALHWTCRLGNVEACRTLLSRAAASSIRTKKCDYDALYMAVRHGQSQIIKLLVDHRAIVDAPCKMDGSTPLHAAALQGLVEVMRVLLVAGAYVNALDSEGMTPLWWASLSRQNDAAKLLVEHGADLETRIKFEPASLDMRSPLSILWQAVMSQNYRLMRLLLTHGADSNSAGVYCMQPIHWAASKGDLLSVTLLLEYDADSEATTDALWTALHYAARNGHRRVCQLLVRCGANERAKTNAGLTPGELAHKYGHEYSL